MALSTPTLGLRDRLRAHRSRAVDVLVLAATIAALWQSAPAIRDTIRAARESARETVSDRELAPAYALGVPPAVLIGAANVLPPDARYTVVLDESRQQHGPRRQGVAPVLHSLLLPRRHTALADAEWVISYRAPLDTLGLRFGRQVEVAPGVIVAEISR